MRLHGRCFAGASASPLSTHDLRRPLLLGSSQRVCVVRLFFVFCGDSNTCATREKHNMRSLVTFAMTWSLRCMTRDVKRGATNNTASRKRRLQPWPREKIPESVSSAVLSLPAIPPHTGFSPLRVLEDNGVASITGRNIELDEKARAKQIRPPAQQSGVGGQFCLRLLW